jgi:hypothetical protein
LDLTGVSGAVVRHFGYWLQRRPSFCAGFISGVVVSKGLQSGGTVEAAVPKNVEMLADDFLLAELKGFMEEHIIPRLEHERQHVCTLKGFGSLSSVDVGEIWCSCVLASCEKVPVLENPKRSDSLIFTEGIHYRRKGNFVRERLPSWHLPAGEASLPPRGA